MNFPPSTEHALVLNPSPNRINDDNSLDITIESMAEVIAAAVQLSASSGAPSSLSLGSASIIQPFSKIEKNKRCKNNLFSIFSWKKNTAVKDTKAVSFNFDNVLGSKDTNSFQKLDDGKDELQYRGIQIKEVKATLKTLVISEHVRCPMPQVKLERPQFAYINY
jgi:hypothetical protein